MTLIYGFATKGVVFLVNGLALTLDFQPHVQHGSMDGNGNILN